MKVFQIIAIFVLSGCSTLSQHATLLSKNINFSDVEKISFGKSTIHYLKENFGNPSEIATNILENEDIWFYLVSIDGSHTIKASFTVGKKDGVVVGAVWVPFNSDPFSNEKEVLSHFKNIKFKIEKKAVIAKHFHVDDLEYSDSRTGLSFSVVKPSSVVTAISFGIPQESRVPAVYR